jgi:cytochrome c oxidase subunit 2
MMGRWTTGVLLALGLVAAGASGASAQSRGAALGQEIFDLHTLVLWICVAIFTGVFGAMLFAVIYHRKSVGHERTHFHENTVVEVIWTIVPFFILVALAWPAAKTLITQKYTSAADLTIKATGYQWKWRYDYLQGEGEGISFYSTASAPREQVESMVAKGGDYLPEVDKPMVVPIGKRVHMLVTSADVLHAWWVPALAAKQDAIPGTVRDTWFKAEREGRFFGKCAELCGKGHGFMPIVVDVLSAERYTAWVNERTRKVAAPRDDANSVWSLSDLKTRGEKVFTQNCAACHQTNGMGIPGTFPTLAGSGVVTGPKEGMIELLIDGVIRDGKPTAMTGFERLSDIELAAVITYSRNSWSNNVGDVITPADIKIAPK